MATLEPLKPCPFCGGEPEVERVGTNVELAGPVGETDQPWVGVRNAVETAIDISKDSRGQTWAKGLRGSLSKITKWSTAPGLEMRNTIS